jgi:hypothetical protein
MLATVAHFRKGIGALQALFGAPLFSFLSDEPVPLCFPLTDRTELLSATRDATVVFSVVGFTLETLTIGLGLGVAHLAAHIVLGLNLGRNDEPTTATVLTGIDDRSRMCVCARVMARERTPGVRGAAGGVNGLRKPRADPD